MQIAALDRLIRSFAAQSEASRLMLQQCLSKRVAAERKLADLAGEDRTRRAQPGGSAAQIVCDAPWQKLLQARRADLNMELARARAAEALARERAAHDFGRLRATEKLRERQLAELRRTRMRRAADGAR